MLSPLPGNPVEAPAQGSIPFPGQQLQTAQAHARKEDSHCSVPFNLPAAINALSLSPAAQITGLDRAARIQLEQEGK